jgi:hypothetical protein
MSQQSQQEIRRLESNLNLLKREREVLQDEWDRKRKAFMDQMSISTTATNKNWLTNQIVQLNIEYGRKKNDIDLKIYENRMMYFKKLQG